MVKVVIFDMGGVLTPGGKERTNESAAEQVMGLPAGTIQIPDLNDKLRRGRMTNEQYIAEINERYYDAPSPLTDKMWDDIFASLKLEQKAQKFAGLCRRSGLYVALLSNVSPGMATRLKEGGAYNGFDPVVLSCYAGFAKPDPEIYALVEAKFPNINPRDFLLLDDQKKCIDGAVMRGWQALQVESPEQMVLEAGELLGLS